MTKYITYLQLRVARHILNLGVREIAKLLKVSKSTISKTELGKTRDFLYKHSAALIDYFTRNNISFPNEYSIRYLTHTSQHSNTPNLTRFQLKAARHLLNINQQELAELINIDKNIITRAEKLDNIALINLPNEEIQKKLFVLFQNHNIEFPDNLSIFYKKYIDKLSEH